jgi:hypothetical protein
MPSVLEEVAGLSWTDQKSVRAEALRSLRQSQWFLLGSPLVQHDLDQLLGRIFSRPMEFYMMDVSARKLNLNTRFIISIHDEMLRHRA